MNGGHLTLEGLPPTPEHVVKEHVVPPELQELITSTSSNTISSMNYMTEESRSSSSNISGSMNCKKREAKAKAIAVAILVAV